MNNRTFVHRIIELSSSRLVTDAVGVGEYLDLFSLMCVYVCVSVGYIYIIYAVMKMTLHEVMSARFPNFSAHNNVHCTLDT
jgi:hypothetical protein